MPPGGTTPAVIRRLRLPRSPLAAALGVGLVCCALTLVARDAGWLEPLELAVYDAHLRWRTEPGPWPLPSGSDAGDAAADSPAVVLVEITPEGAADLGETSWPPSDRLLARVIARAAALGATVIGLDLLRPAAVAPGTRDLLDICERADDLVGLSRAPPDPRLQAPGLGCLEAEGRVGLDDLVRDADGMVRRASLYVPSGDGLRAGFSMAIADRHLASTTGARAGHSPSDPTQLVLGSQPVPRLRHDEGGYARTRPEGYQVLLDFATPAAAIPRIDAAELVAGDAPRGILGARAAIVGLIPTAPSVAGSRPLTPLGGHGPGGTSALRAMLVDQLLRSASGQARAVRGAHERAEVLWVLGWSLAGALAGWALRRPGAGAVAGALGAAAGQALTHASLAFGLWLPAAGPVAGFGAAYLVTGAWCLSRRLRARSRLARAFLHPPRGALREEIWTNRALLTTPRRWRALSAAATVMAVHVECYEEAADTLEPGPLLDWLGAIHRLVRESAQTREGIVVRAAGRSIVVAWGLPVPRLEDAAVDRDADRAARCALDIAEAAAALDEAARTAGVPRLLLGLGLHTGEVVAGTPGRRLDGRYDVHGHTVRAALALAAFAGRGIDPDREDSPCRIALSGQCLDRLDDDYELAREGPLLDAPIGPGEHLVAFRLLARMSHQTASGPAGGGPGSRG